MYVYESNEQIIYANRLDVHVKMVRACSGRMHCDGINNMNIREEYLDERDDFDIKGLWYENE